MARLLKEINRFNLGMVLNASEKDTPEDAATFSLNVNPIAANGILDAINNDKLIIDIGDNSTLTTTPVSWKSIDGTNVALNLYNTSSVEVDNIDVLDNQDVVEFSFIGTNGIRDTLLGYDVEPSWELIKNKNVNTPKLSLAENFNIGDDYFVYEKAGGKTSGVDLLDLDGVIGEGSDTSITSHNGGTITFDVSATDVSGATVPANGLFLGVSGLTDAEITTLFIEAFNGDNGDNGDRVKYGANGNTTDGITHSFFGPKTFLKAVAGTDSENVSFTAEYEGSWSNMGGTDDVLYNGGWAMYSGEAVVISQSFIGGYSYGLRHADAVLTVASYAGFDQTDYITLISADGDTYRFYGDNAGTAGTYTNEKYIAFVGETSNEKTAENLRDAINQYSGVFRAYTYGAIVGVRQVIPGVAGNTTAATTTSGEIAVTASFTGGTGFYNFENRFRAGDYIALGSGTFKGRTNQEILRIKHFDTGSKRCYVDRGCFGTQRIAITGIVNDYVTLTVPDGDAADGMAETQYFLMRTDDGCNIAYVLSDTNASLGGAATGTIIESSTDLGTDTAANLNAPYAGDSLSEGLTNAIAVGMDLASATQKDFLVQLKAAIEHTNGHGATRVTVGDVVGSTDACTLLITSEFGDVAGATHAGQSFTETLGNFSVSSASFAGGSITATDVYTSAKTINNLQVFNKRGTMKVRGWNLSSGNNIGGNSLWFRRGNVDVNIKNCGKIADCGSAGSTAVFDSTGKTVTLGSAMGGASFPLINEGEYITFYSDQNHAGIYLNNDFTAKVLKRDTTNRIFTLDTAPTTATQNDNALYMEATLVKNGTFTHSVNTSSYDVGSDKIYKFNNWTHRHYEFKTGGGPNADTFTNRYVNSESTYFSKIAKVASGGYLDAAWISQTSRDESANYYPFETIAPFAEIESHFGKFEIVDYIALVTALNDGSTEALQTTFETPGDAGELLAANDIIYIDDDSAADIEYMQVEKVEGKLITVQRGLYGSTIKAHPVYSVSATTEGKIYRCLNHLIRQDIAKERVVKGQKYSLVFYAKNEDITKHTRAFLSVKINGGHFDETGSWVESTDNWQNGYYFGTESTEKPFVMQEIRWIDFNQLQNPDGGIPVDADGNPVENNLDTIWRKYKFIFEIPSRVELKTDLIIEFSNRGIQGSKLGIDMVRLDIETPLAFKNKDVSAISTSALLDNGGTKDLILYDSVKGKLSAVTGFNTDTLSAFNISDVPNKSANAAQSIVSSNGQATMVPKNREIHIGFGGEQGDTPPQWLGYVNHKVFGRNYTDELYQDEDTIPPYGGSSAAGAASLDKICLAGEYEYCAASISGTSLTVTIDNHNFIIGDNVIIREWSDTAMEWPGTGVWVVINSTATVGTANAIVCQRITATGPGSALFDKPAGDTFIKANGDITIRDNDGASTPGRVNVRPYYYYGCKDGDPYLYRINPDVQYTAVGTKSTVYVKGTIEKSGVIGVPIHSICTYYNKKTTGEDGGRIYALSAHTDDIYVLGVDIAYNEWKTSIPQTHSVINVECKTHVWSNDHINGNAHGGTRGVPLWGDSPLSNAVSPTIDYAGILSDIIETKGPTSDVTNLYNLKATTTPNTPVNFDTRLWIQCRPESESSGFIDGNRWLWCGKTEEDNTETSQTIYFADRTPSMYKALGVHYAYHFGASAGERVRFAAGPGADASYGDWHGPSPEGHSYHLHYHSYFWTWIYRQGHTSAPGDDLLESMSAVHNSHKHASYSHAMYGQYRTVGMVNFGDNVGWASIYNSSPAGAFIKVAKYGLFQVADNDCDGVLDGTGVVVPSTDSITNTADRCGPYGRLHTRVCSHAVGVLGGSPTPWQRNFGKMHAVDSQFFYAIRGDYSQNSPEHLDVNKCIFVCTDMHSGDSHYRLNGYTFTSIAADTTDSNQSWVTFSNAYAPYMEDFEAGDMCFLDPSTLGTGGDILHYQSTTIIDVDYSASQNGASTYKIKIPLKAPTSGTTAGILYPMSMHKRWDGGFYSGSTIGASEPMWHHGWWSYHPMQGHDYSAWNKTQLCKHWYTPPSYAAAGGNIAYAAYDTWAPGYVFPLDKLSFRAGYMIRPFLMETADFNRLQIGTGLSIDMPSYPDAIYHTRSAGQSGGSFRHCSIGAHGPDHAHASKLFITAPLERDSTELEDLSKIYMCDLQFMYPSSSNHIEVLRASGNLNADALASGAHWDLWTGGNGIVAYHTDKTTTIATTYWVRDVDIHPVVELAVSSTDLKTKTNLFQVGSNMRRTNALHGLCLTIIDSETGTMQTRYVVGSKRKGVNPSGHPSTDNSNMLIQVHYPFAHPPTVDDSWFLWKHANAVTAPVRLNKIAPLSYGLGPKRSASKSAATAYTQGERTNHGYIYDHLTGSQIFHPYKEIADLDISSNVATATTRENHNLTVGDYTRIMMGKDSTGTSVATFDDTVKIVTVPSTISFTYATTAGDSTNNTAFTAPVAGEEWTENPYNPLTLDMSMPVLKASYGGLDLRKTRTYDVSATADDSADMDFTSSAHSVQTGDTVTYVSEMIEAAKNLTMEASNDWARYQPSTTLAAFDNTTGGKITIRGTTNVAKEGTTLPNSVIADIASGQKYIVRASIWSTTDLSGFKVSIGGIESAVFTISTDQTPKEFIITATSTSGLYIYQEFNNVVDWFIDNVSVRCISEEGIFQAEAQDANTVEVVQNAQNRPAKGTLHTNQFELLLAEQSGSMHMGELRAGFNAWDRGQFAGNIYRSDRDTIGDINVYMNITESSVDIQTNSIANQSGDFFAKNQSYYYKVSLIYDGYQEGPLSKSTWVWKDTVSRQMLGVTVKASLPSRRLSAVCLYRKDDVNDHFKLVKQKSTAGGWRNEDDVYSYVFGDKGQLGASYQSRTGLSELLDTIQVRYGVSSDIDGYLFVGDCSHSRVENAKNMLFRSKPGMFSIFDYVNDYLELKSKPTALVNFSGRLYAFDANNIYKINQHSLTIEDIYEGIGCLGKNSVVVTEYGMFFADRNGAYLHSGSAPQRISESIHTGGDLTKFDDVGTDNIYDLSWKNTVGTNLYKAPSIVYDSDTTSILFIVDFTSSKLKGEEQQSFSKSFIWCYNIPNSRWDLWELTEGEEVGVPFLGKEGEVLIPVGSGIFLSRGSNSKRHYTWVSKKMSMEEDSIVKVYNKVKVNGVTNSLTQGGDNLESSDRLLLATSNGAIATSDITYSSDDVNYSQYRLSGANKKGRWLQVKLEDMTEPVDSIGVFYRRKGNK